MTLALCAVLAVPIVPARADPPDDAVPVTATEALACVVARYRGEPLRIRDRDRGLVQDVRWLTPAGNVLQIEITGPGCRFVEVDGVGQDVARILPGETR